MFKAIDIDGSNSIAFEELTHELIQIRAAIALDSLEIEF